MVRERSAKQLANDKVMEVFQAEYPPFAPWNNTMYTRQLGILKKALLNQGYTHDEVVDAIRYARMKGKKCHSLAFIPYVIEESKIYWAQVREREEQQRKLAEQQQHTTIDVSEVKRVAPSWLGVDGEFEEV